MTPEARRFAKPLATLIVALVLFPLLVKNPYHLSVLNLIGVNALVATGLGLLIGFAGQTSLGHAAFFGLGAYISGVLSIRLGLSPWLTMPTAAALTALPALFLGAATLRLSGNYLVMATLGFNIIVETALVQADSLTGGSSGLTGIPPATLFGLSFDADARFFWLIWPLAVGALCLVRNIVDSPLGRALKALHDSPEAALACGVNVARRKIEVFVLSAVFAALAGALYAHWIGLAAPKTFDVFKSVEFATMCLVGGLHSIWGPLVGAAFLTPLPQVLHVFEGRHDVVYGAILLVTLMFAPEGLIGVGKALLARFGRRP